MSAPMDGRRDIPRALWRTAYAGVRAFSRPVLRQRYLPLLGGALASAACHQAAGCLFERDEDARLARFFAGRSPRYRRKLAPFIAPMLPG